MTCCGVELDSTWPEGFTALEAVVVVKCLDDDGAVNLVSAASAGLSAWEAVGMLEHTSRTLLDGLARTTSEED